MAGQMSNVGKNTFFQLYTPMLALTWQAGHKPIHCGVHELLWITILFILCVFTLTLLA